MLSGEVVKGGLACEWERLSGEVVGGVRDARGGKPSRVALTSTEGSIFHPASIKIKFNFISK